MNRNLAIIWSTLALSTVVIGQETEGQVTRESLEREITQVAAIKSLKAALGDEYRTVRLAAAAAIEKIEQAE